MLPKEINAALQQGAVIPAHPLALDRNRRLDERRQRALTRYYLDAGVGGVAVAVHTTQFEIRQPGIDLLRPVLQLAKEEIDAFVEKTQKPIIRIAGIVGRTRQAVMESQLAADLGWHAGLLSLAAFAKDSNRTILEHCRAVAENIPLVGFYLQPAVGGRILDVDFWREFAGIENVVAIKIAPFNRYQTLDVVRGVMESGRGEEIALYTGNDDNIVADLLTEYGFASPGRKKRIVGGLLGHWAVWARSAVNLFEKIKKADAEAVSGLLALGARVTDCNAAFFDAANSFYGCIVGLHEVLRRQGLLDNLLTLNENEVLTPAQKREIDRVYAAYPDLNDDAFVAENLQKWLS